MLPPSQEILFTRQRHEAKKAGLHYDIRFVVGDKAYSFATKKEIPEPGKAILLYEQPVHDAAYALSQRVEIPDGQYGAGVTTLDFVHKARVGEHSTPEQMTITSKAGRFLLKKLDEEKYGKKAWLFKNLEMNNKYLEKISEVITTKVDSGPSNPGFKIPAIEALAGGLAIRASPNNLLGYDVVYHGTTKQNAASIKKHGFDPLKGGSNNASFNPIFSVLSEGKTHFTKSYLTANQYAGKLDQHGFDLPALVRERIHNGEVIKARIPTRTYSKFEMDSTHSLFSDQSDSVRKDLASKTSRHIGTRFIGGAEGGRGIANFLDKRHLKAYYSTNQGKLRALKGAGLAALGAGLIADSARRLKNDEQVSD